MGDIVVDLSVGSPFLRDTRTHVTQRLRVVRLVMYPLLWPSVQLSSFKPRENVTFLTVRQWSVTQVDAPRQLGPYAWHATAAIIEW
jgi:hypothetical protein